MPRVEEVSLYRLRVRLGQAFRIAYASSSYAETLVVAVRGGGVTGWGEAAPAPRVTCENQGSVKAYVEAVVRRILGTDPLEGLGRLLQTVHAAGGCFSAARAALEAALLDLAAKQLGVPASELLGGRLHSCLETDYTVGLPPRESVVDIAARRGRAPKPRDVLDCLRECFPGTPPPRGYVLHGLPRGKPYRVVGLEAAVEPPAQQL